MNDQIDQASASGAENLQPDATHADIEKPSSQSAELHEGGPNQAADDDNAPFPKKAQNALAREKNEKRQMRAQMRVMEERYEARIRALEERYSSAQGGKDPKDAAPNENDFDNYGDYLKAAAKHEALQALKQEQESAQKAQKGNQQQQQYAAWVDKRSTDLDTVAGEVIKQVPDLEQLYQDNADIVADFPPQIKHVILETDPTEAVQAFFTLAKEGKLEALGQLSPARAAIEIARAAERGANSLTAKPVSKAPAPMSPNRGTGSASKPESSMSGRELRQKYGHI